MASTVAQRIGLDDKDYEGAGFGVEVELEGATPLFMERPPEGWRCVNDNSLRNGGIEYVMEGPCIYKDSVERLERLYAIKARSMMHTSQRTGMHVHVDVRHLTTKQVGNLYAAYVACEPWLMALAGESRWHNVFCVPSHANVLQAASVVRLVRSTGGLGASCRTLFNKYSSFNLLPMVSQGSIEFRMAPAYEDLDSALRWLSAINHIVEASERFEARSIAGEYLDDARGCVRSMFPALHELTDPVAWAVPLEDASMATLLAITPNSAPREPVQW